MPIDEADRVQRLEEKVHLLELNTQALELKIQVLMLENLRLINVLRSAIPTNVLITPASPSEVSMSLGEVFDSIYERVNG